MPEFEDLTSRELEARIVTTGIDPETGDTTIEINDKVAAELMRRSMWDVFARSRDAIEATDLGDLPISPIDAMRQAVERAGIRTGEITGRKRGIDSNGEIYVRPAADTSKPARRVAQSAFNNEDLDFLVINQSGSTGISLHASEKAKVQSTRVMIVAQPNLDINEFMQTLGRIHRSGQVANPEFILLQTALPAEKRPAAILGKKMSMLNANTTSNAKTDVSEGNTAIDIFNQYGDEMAYKVLERDRDLQDQLRPLGLSLAKFFNEQTGALIPYQDAQQAVNEQPDGYIARTITGYLAILPVEEQEIFWEKTLADYNAYISYLDQIGQNALEAKALDLQAKTVSSEVFTEKADGDSAFSAPSYIETVETKVGKKPLTGEKAVEMSEKGKAGSKQILQAYISSADTAANDQADKKAKRALKPWDSEKRSEFLSNQRAQRNVIASAISLVGRFGSVNRNDGNAGLGVIEEIKLDEANPLTPSKQIAIIRVNDSRETLKVPVTQLAEAFTPAPNESAKEWDDSTDIGGESAIATGNLMAAMKQLGGAGKVITYTTDSGVDQMGILLPKSFMTKRAAIKARVQIKTAEQMLEILDAGFQVTNSDGTIKWTKGASVASLSVPASRAKGGDIWRNPMMNRISMGGEFTQVGNEMRATYALGNVRLAFQFLTEAGETFSSPKESNDSDGLRSSELPSPQKLRADSPEWKAMSKDERMAYLQHQKGGLRASELPNPTSQKGLEYSAREAERVLDEHAPSLPEKLTSQVATFRESARTLDSGREASNGSREEAVSAIIKWAKSQERLIDPEDFSRLGDPNSNSTSEHEVWRMGPTGRAVKRTWAGVFGQVPALWKGKILMKNASLPEYLRRMALQISVFGSDIQFEGVTVSDKPSMIIGQPASQPSAVISQEWITAANPRLPHPEDTQIAAFMRDQGFEKIRDSFHGWAREDGVIVMDAKPDNFILSDKGIVPIDLQIGAIGKAEVSGLEYGEGLRSSDLPARSNDAAYLKAVESGDMGTAQRMVDEAAKAAGYTEEGHRAGVYRSGVPLLPSTTGGLGSGYYAILGGRLEDVNSFAADVDRGLKNDPQIEARQERVMLDLGDKSLRVLNLSDVSGWVDRQGLRPAYRAWLDYQETVNSAYNKVGGKRPDSLEARRGSNLVRRTPADKKAYKDALLSQGWNEEQLTSLELDIETIETEDVGKNVSFLFDKGHLTSVVIDWEKAASVGRKAGDGRMFMEVAVANPNQIKSADPVTRMPTAT